MTIDKRRAAVRRAMTRARQSRNRNSAAALLRVAHGASAIAMYVAATRASFSACEPGGQWVGVRIVDKGRVEVDMARLDSAFRWVARDRD